MDFAKATEAAVPLSNVPPHELFYSNYINYQLTDCEISIATRREQPRTNVKKVPNTRHLFMHKECEY